MSEDEKQKWISDRLRPKIRERGQKLSRVPEGMWTKCPSCGELLQSKNLINNLSVCASCEYHFRVKALDRIEMLFDEFTETFPDLRSNDPIKFYDKKSYKGNSERVINICHRRLYHRLFLSLTFFRADGNNRLFSGQVHCLFCFLNSISLVYKPDKKRI